MVNLLRLFVFIAALFVNRSVTADPTDIDWSSLEETYLKASNGQSGDWLGVSVAISGKTVAVGAWNEDTGAPGINPTPDENAVNSGAVYIFVNDGGVWTQQAFIKANNPGAGDLFGAAIGLSGNFLVVGAPGEDSSGRGVDTLPDEGRPDSGAAYVFVREEGNWIQRAFLKALNADSGDNLGSSVGLDGNIAVVGALLEESGTSGVNTVSDNLVEGAGAAYVFTRKEGAWSQEAYLKASNPGEFYRFGFTAACSGETVVIGADLEGSSSVGVNSTPNTNAEQAGAAYVFVREDGLWSQQAYLKASNTGPVDVFGSFVGISGDTVVVGAPLEDSGTTGINTIPDDASPNSGAAYVFTRRDRTWVQEAYVKPEFNEGDARFGINTRVHGDTLVSGAFFEDDGTSDAGAVYLFTRGPGGWAECARIRAANPGMGDNFGLSTALAGNTLVVGAWTEDGSATMVDGAHDDLAPDAGAAHIFALPRPAAQLAIHREEGVTILQYDGGSIALQHGTMLDDFVLLDPTEYAIELGGSPVTTTVRVPDNGQPTRFFRLATP